MENKNEYQAQLFSNRLKKKYKELRKWARKNRISCYRLYDRDIPEIPVSLDLYEFLPSDVTTPLEVARFLSEQNANLSANNPQTEQDIKQRSYAILYLYERPYQKEDSEEELWLSLMAQAAAEVLGIPLQNIITKMRRHQKGKSQYEKNEDSPIKYGNDKTSPHHFENTSALRHCEERSDVAILRPLLTFTRKQIEGHVFAWKVPYREDSTNFSVEYRRNSIRHEVFPLFERMNPSYVRTLNREMTYLSDASSIVDEWCKEHVEHVLENGGISIPRLLEIPQWRYLLYYILEPYGFNTSVLESLENLLMSDRTISGKRFESAGYVLRTERQSLVVVPKMADHAGHDVAVIPDLIGDPFVPVRGAGAYHCNGKRFVVEVLPWSAEMPLQQPAGMLIFDADKLKFPFVCRGWRNGDWMIPLGMKGKKKLSDMFTDLKYNYQDKENALVLVDCTGDRAEKQHIAALLGARIDDQYKVSDRTTSIIRITL